MFDTVMEVLKGFIPNGGGSVYTSNSSNGFGLLDVIVKNSSGQVSQTFQGLDVSKANDLVRQLLGQ